MLSIWISCVGLIIAILGIGASIGRVVAGCRAGWLLGAIHAFCWCVSITVLWNVVMDVLGGFAFAFFHPQANTFFQWAYISSFAGILVGGVLGGLVARYGQSKMPQCQGRVR